MHERQRACQRIHFASNETEDEILHGLLEGGTTENGLNKVLDLTVEVVEGSVEGGSGRVDPAKDAIVDCVLDAVHLGVDLGNVGRRLVQHVLVHGRGDCVGEIACGRKSLIAIRLRDGTKSEQLNLNTDETDEADEEARESGWVEDVAEEPLDVNVLGVRKVEKRGHLIGDSHEKRVSSDTVEGEKVVVRERDDGRRASGGIVIDSGVGGPSLPDVLEVVLEATPLVPFESAVGKDEEEDDDDDDDGGNLGHLDNVMAEVVDDRGVNLIAESDGGLLGNGEDGLLEGDVVERLSDLLLCQLEGSVETEEP